ncbi:DUF434 domain-containing protein [Methanolobus mangrovi]|uniref:DUF434 domain-containing protein n=1 Tax=Methanolobus mangrovi TaxID=3072977 RepID=A0AA51YGS5_9EURY|nr:DUF434 domain-containing protein [Methanolobus mangrovi]WMW22367.1 DUF434 domain-containing protein [Methanolobus mangrovi]
MIGNYLNKKDRQPEMMAKAATDIRYLLERGYQRESSIRFAGDHYRLGRNERYILARTVFSSETSMERKKKKLNCGELKGRTVLIDGYNVLITLESLLKGERTWLADDSFLRDIRGVFRNHSNDDVTFEAVEKMLSFVSRSKVKEANVLLDTQMKNSGELAAFIRKRMQELEITGSAMTSRHVDYDLKNCYISDVVATADGIIIDSVNNVIDIPACISRE